MPPKSIFRQPGAKHFQLVHRSQRDPLIHDPDASQHVLKAFVRGNEKKGKTRSDLEDVLASDVIDHDVRANVGEAAMYGVYFDDTEYDYMQHLRTVGAEEEGVESILIEAAASFNQPKAKGKGKARSDDPISLKDIPEEALPSKTELPRNFEMQEAVPSSIAGFQPDMNPHLRQALEALEDDAFVDDDAEDNFFSDLVREGERDDGEEGDYEFYEYGPPEEGNGLEEGLEEDESWEARFAKFKREKKDVPSPPGSDDDLYSEGGDTVGNLPKLPVIGGKRRRKGTSDASGYSMSSSSMYRTDTLLTLDERFDQLMAKEYDSDDEEALDDEGLETASTSSSLSSSSVPDLITSREDFVGIMDEFMEKYEVVGRKLKPVLDGESGVEKLETLRLAMGQDERVRVVAMGEGDEADLDDDDELFRAYDANEKEDRWDCETVLTTYSNLENHPRIIRTRTSKPVPKIKLDPRTGLPSVSKDGEQGNRKLDTLSEEGERDDRVVRQTVTRPRSESKEDKKARKQAVKAERQARRTDKKATKEQFDAEIKHQAQNYKWNGSQSMQYRTGGSLEMASRLVTEGLSSRQYAGLLLNDLGDDEPAPDAVSVMESPHICSPLLSSHNGVPGRSRSSSKLADEVTSLTSFNPFSEEDENDQSSYALVTSLFSRMKSSFATPLAVTSPTPPASGPQAVPNNDQRRPSSNALNNAYSNLSTTRPSSEQRPTSLKLISAIPAPPLVSLTPVVFEAPSFGHDPDRSPSRGAHIPPFYDAPEGGACGTSIPGFPIQDDARSIRTSASLNRSASVSKVIRRIRGEGLSRDYWMDDENAKECYDCKSVFTTWRRKHHCRICGQIFCSRCASNIIKGSRFGHDGMVRVCNLCLEKLAKVDEDDDDDRRSVVSSSTSPFPAHQLGSDAFTLSLGHHPQSPFAASQLFGRTDEPFNLYSIAETKRLASGLEDSTSGSPLEWEPVRDTTAPFRRNLAEDEKDPATLGQQQNAAYSPPTTDPRAGTPIDFPVTVPVNFDKSTMSTIQFPLSSPDHVPGPDSPATYGAMRSRFNSFGDVATPFIRSRVQSRLDNFPTVEGWRTRRDSTAYAQELNLISMFHLRIMLRQMLTTENIPNVKEWEETLLKIALRIARELTFTALPYHQGEDMDVRRYVKIKKIPGGAPSDSEYVDGAVITKNVAHKQMLRTQRNPRVMLVTFPLEFHRVEGQYVNFGQIMRQEKEYLGNLVSRIAALRPHIVMVEQSVSRIALEGLAQHNIAVARAVKPSAISFVARMTQGDVFSSMDKLALEPRLGHCARFRVQTFDHPLIPGQRKSYLRFEGCNRDMGCTIILRGGDSETLRRVKKVTRFLTFIVRNLKLETHLWKDSVITLPALPLEAVPASLATQGNLLEGPNGNGQGQGGGALVPASVSMVQLAMPAEKEKAKADMLTIEDTAEEDLPDADAERLRLSKRIQQSVEPYFKTFISVSATLRFLPPQPILKMEELDEELTRVQHAWEDDLVRREERGNLDKLKGSDKAASGTPTPERKAIDITSSSSTHDTEDVKAQIEALVLPDLPRTPPPEAAGLLHVEDPKSYFEPQPLSSAPILPGSPFVLSPHLILPGSPFVLSPHPIIVANPVDIEPAPLKTTEDIALASQLGLVKYKHEEQRRIWEWYLRKNADDFVVEKYQCIALWRYTVPIEDFGTRRACFAPSLHYVTFYGENDCTLGQFIEKAVNETLAQFLDPKAVCAGKGCNQPLARHCQVFVHNETRLSVAVEQWDGQIKARNIYPAPDMITTWSACRVCGSATPFIPISEEMQRYSFGKFLELHFYPADVKLVQGAGCQHNIYQHHVRYFATRGMTVRFQADPVTLHEVVYPAIRIRIRPEIQLELKNADFEKLHRRNTAWYTALVDDLKLISIDAATGEEEHDARLTTDINYLIARAEAERQEITHFINQVYQESSPTDTLALNQVRSFRQDRIVAWQADFDKLPKPRNTIEKNGRRVSAFNSVRAIWPKRYDISTPFGESYMPSASVSEAEEGRLSRRQTTGESLVSSASEASEAEQEPHSEKLSEKASPLKSDDEPAGPPPVDLASPATKSDPDSDSTIGASKDDSVLSGKIGHSQPTKQAEQSDPEADRPPPRVSRLPRRTTQPPSVAELVARYQDFIPATGVEELARTALAPPPVSESEQEDLTTTQSTLNIPRPIFPRSTIRGRHRHELTRMPSTSDFESGYAANAAPRFRRSLGGHGHYASRIPGGSSLESQATSRRASPDKRGSRTLGEPSSPSQHGRSLPPPSAGRTLRGKTSSRGVGRDTPQTRPVPGTPGTKGPFRRPPQGAGTKVSNIARHFERISRDSEKFNRRYAVIRGRKPRPVATSRVTVEVLESIKDAIKDETDISDSSSEADDEGGDEDEGRKPTDKITESSPEQSTTLPIVTVQEHTDTISAPVPLREEPAPPPTSTPPLSPPIVDTEPPRSFPPSPFLRSPPPEPPTPPTISLDELPGRSSIFRQAFSGLWPPQLPSKRVELDEDPLNDPEHIFRDSSMVVRTDEPTSIIALALNSPLYRDMLAKSRAEKRTSREPKLTEGGEAFMPDDQSVSECSSTWGVVNVDTSETVNLTDELKSPSTKMSWVISFESGGLTISCTILYPEQFDALRRTYDCERSIIESLSRCVKWDANGGKSGSAFLKTRDDRFVAKELSRAELQTMETFAPAYFDYMASAVSGNRPTLLAKVFGCYKLTFKKSKENGPSRAKVTQMNLLVMENLFCNRRFSKIYDLKGSTRNRHVQSTGRENEVLLDENLVETAHFSPFYVKEHTKRILRGALYNDSKFLSDINVMDYSLVVGVDNETHELVVGIVDYIRTYTWDKKLESWVKESAFLGGGGKGEPTIVGPKQYRQRFISAMERYFPLAPDRWMKQKDAPEDDPNSLVDLWPDW